MFTKKLLFNLRLGAFIFLCIIETFKKAEKKITDTDT